MLRRPSPFRVLIDGLGVRDGYGEPYGDSRYRGVPSVAEKYPPLPLLSATSVVPSPSALAMARGLPNGDDFFLGNCPRMTESDAELFPLLLVNPFASNDEGSGVAGWLYIHVATRTMEEPMMKEGVMRKSNRATEARKDRMIERLVANPLRMLSEYLITTAVMRPPNT